MTIRLQSLWNGPGQDLGEGVQEGSGFLPFGCGESGFVGSDAYSAVGRCPHGSDGHGQKWRGMTSGDGLAEGTGFGPGHSDGQGDPQGEGPEWIL